MSPPNTAGPETCAICERPLYDEGCIQCDASSCDACLAPSFRLRWTSVYSENDCQACATCRRDEDDPEPASEAERQAVLAVWRERWARNLRAFAL